MAVVHERVFRVRHYECDAYGHVNNANYLRYMQEAAFDASAAVGYDMAWYAQAGQHWLIRATTIDYLRPLTYSDAVIVKTWVADFRRVRSRRAYELRHADRGDVMATAHTDWVYLDTKSGRPTTIPSAMIDAFYPEGAPGERPYRERFPNPPPPPPDVYTQTRQVAWHEVDPVGHVNNAVYLSYMEEAAIGICRQCGWSMGRMMAAGFGIVARRFQVEYKKPALVDDTVAVATWVSDVKRATAVRHYTIRRAEDGELLVRARGRFAWIDLETGRPRRVPADFLSDLAVNVVD